MEGSIEIVDGLRAGTEITVVSSQVIYAGQLAKYVLSFKMSTEEYF